MYKKFFIATLCIGFLGIKSVHAMEYHTTDNYVTKIGYGIHRVIKGAAKTIIENPITSTIGAYYLIADREAIRQNTFWSAVFGASLLASFVKNVVSPKSHPKNFIVSTLWKHPFFSFVAGHMLLLHRDKIKNYPLESMIVGGTLLYSLASDYNRKPIYEDDGLLTV